MDEELPLNGSLNSREFPSEGKRREILDCLFRIEQEAIVINQLVEL